jgi:hypothetical protein
MSESDMAKTALELYAKYTKIGEELEATKVLLRSAAGGSKKEIIVEGLGKINISAPSAGSTRTVLVLDEEVLAKAADLKNKLLEKGVIRKETKSSNPSAAKVTISLNV